MHQASEKRKKINYSVVFLDQLQIMHGRAPKDAVNFFMSFKLSFNNMMHFYRSKKLLKYFSGFAMCS